MVVGEIAEPVDLLVVGGGPAGYAAALHAGGRGRGVMLVDRDGVNGLGGVCLRRGCIPSKALIELAHLAHSAAGHPAMRKVARVDLAAFRQHKNEIITALADGVTGLMKAANVDVSAGEVRFTRPDQAVIRTSDGHARFVEFNDVVIATGSRPAQVPELAVDHVTVLDSTSALNLDHVPATLAVIGAGYIGVELGTALAKLGASVTLVEASDRVLPGLDAALVRPVVRRLTDLGVTVLTESQVVGHANGILKVVGNSGEIDVEADQVVLAVGRRPNTDELGLHRLGVPVRSDGLLNVGPNRLIRNHVAAVGDVTPGPALAHKGYAEALVAVSALCGDRTVFHPAAIPAVVFSDPEIATVGLTAADAQREGAEVVTVPIASNGRALTLGAANGVVQLVTDKDTGVVLGLHIVGPQASEIIAEGVVAIEMGATAADLSDIIHVHPTVAEQVQEAARSAAGYGLHHPARSGRRATVQTIKPVV
ncbi:dihydrolipoyl dehydrogenase [Mycobacterium sp. 852013-50091_SCH5140682]|uniref:dihydrolipoyl dehydrogenase n=1 Tax=Mycobacterium sp. 852013-50091_SCH5140682 TaxID=1834109 RepID=UPI0007EB1052|nr:dihydrolipoyl dehydrogenase [Mycobacterium sp. 852013-50091_SCH5140682]OBC11931.1 dihydrolipoyl dehydrogenase [Mycobacterium sp. 852013-50091_SCH5140682]